MSLRRTDFHFLSHQDDYTDMITQHHQHNRWLLLFPWVKKLSCGPNHLLLQFLAVPASGFKPYHHPAGSQLSFQILQPKCPPSGTCPHTYYKNSCYINPFPPFSVFCPLLLNAMMFLVEDFAYFSCLKGEVSHLVSEAKSVGTLKEKSRISSHFNVERMSPLQFISKM